MDYCLKNCEIKSIKANKTNKSVKIILEAKEYITLKRELDIIEFFNNKFNTDKILMDIISKSDDLSQEFEKDIIERMIHICPMTEAFKDSISFHDGEDKFTVKIPEDLVQIFKTYNMNKFLVKFLSARTGCKKDVHIISNGQKENFDNIVNMISNKEEKAPIPVPVEVKPEKSKPAQKIKGEVSKISEINNEYDTAVIIGTIIDLNIIETKSKKLLYTFDVTDFTSSITCKIFLTKEKASQMNDIIRMNNWVKVYGRYEYDKYERESNIRVLKIEEANAELRFDSYPEKRVELHLHTKMSPMDAFIEPEQLIAELERWGHKAVAVTDHGVLQAFPQMSKSKNVKIIYGMEGYMIDDGPAYVYNPDERDLPDSVYHVFDCFHIYLLSNGTIAKVEEISDKSIPVCVYGNYDMTVEPLKDMIVMDMARINRSLKLSVIEEFDIESLHSSYMATMNMLREKGISTLKDICIQLSQNDIEKDMFRYHVIILAKNSEGLKNLYELVSESHLSFFYKRPLIPKSFLSAKRKGLILGSACESGEIYRSIIENRTDDELRKTAGFYDYLEIQPVGNNMFLLRENIISSKEILYENNKKIVKLGEELNISVVATCDAHFFEERDSIYRKILMHGQKFDDADNQAPIYFRTTEEMLEEFKYLGEEKAYEVVIKNPNHIADQTEKILPIPKDAYPPVIEGSDEELRLICMNKAKKIYGENLPEKISHRIKKELDSIINNGFSVMYIIAQKLTSKSLSDGYLVGSRGSVGSSFAAFLSDITEINPLEAHYICKQCKYCNFPENEEYECGFDLPDMACPKCGAVLEKAGYDIPFETFLGFEGDKQPDIDLNFSGEYQLNAHRYVEELFGEKNVFKAGTISTIADKTAFGFVKGYGQDKGANLSNAEVKRLVSGISGVKKTTGQHPGGMIVLPKGYSIYQFTPVQRPADDKDSTIVTTHFDFHSLHDTLLKLDILGHDDPTVLKMLGELTGIDPSSVDIIDKNVLKLFTDTEPLGLKKKITSSLGVLGIPEFGTKFVRGMLESTKPDRFSDLVKISGLSHGTDVWLNNAEELIRNNTATLKEVISLRDNIMIYLIHKGLDNRTAFDITERVRKGKSISEEQEKIMLDNNVPKWYVESCKKIKYMFPKAHAAAYVVMALRIAWFKVYYPKEYYSAYFSVRADEFDCEIMAKDYDSLINLISDMDNRYKELSAREKNVYTILEIVIEMNARGIRFYEIDLLKSSSTKFIVEEDGIRLPFASLPGIGINAAEKMETERSIRPFTSIDDLKERTGISKTVIEKLRDMKVLESIPDSSQLSFF